MQKQEQEQKHIMELEKGIEKKVDELLKKDNTYYSLFMSYSFMKNNKFSQEFIEKHINEIFDLKVILYTQKLTADFCVKYMYDMSDSESSDKDSYLWDRNFILTYQTHITKEEFDEALKAYEEMKEMRKMKNEK
jgi:hypothetical protein